MFGESWVGGSEVTDDFEFVLCCCLIYSSSSRDRLVILDME